jgi:hypothetical protein
MSSFQEGYRQGEKVGGVIFIGFRIIWFFVRIAWWLSVLLIVSLVAGIAALIRSGRPRPDVSAGFGHFTDDRAGWQDEKTGALHPVRDEELDTCEVQAIQGGIHWQRTALSRLVKRGAVVRYTFAAVSNGSSTGAHAGTPEIVASEEFLNEARRNITLDHLDPALAAADPYGLQDNREEAVSALDHLDWILTSRGWERTGDLADHWYARTYTRPKILWDQAASATDLPPGIEA